MCTCFVIFLWYMANGLSLVIGIQLWPTEVGYNSIEAEDWEVATSGEETSKPESLLLDKNRKMEHQLTQLKVISYRRTKTHTIRLRDCKAVLSKSAASQVPVRTKSDKPYRLQKFKLSVDFFNQVNILYGTLTEFCTPLTCPTMTAGTKQRIFKVIIEFVAHASMNQLCELLAGKQVDTPLEALKSIVDMGSQKGKLIGYVEISKTGDVFHDIFRYKPHEIVAVVPDKVHDCELHEGERGVVGSVICWHYTQDGKKKIAKEIIESVNEENHMIVFKVIGGELVDELYKSFRIIWHVEPKGEGQVATWTFEFEKPDTSVPYPTSLLDYLCDLVKALDAHNNL
ncbi:hypothetical protein SSX86_027695 [Deinandra increscens subsp. villosa]|uniref:Bet v I/Major latex protein domain-containing protein n=1 Tax=Deinandra increscens subsp. villosa TaxID=3103831 RepID=A0AAP0CCG6_9ASTR